MQEVLNEVLLPSTPEFVRRYPHQLSGGQQQRVGLAMAFACRPSVIVLDEPTTGLDVSTQAHVLATVRDLCRAHGVAALYVTHDLAVVANLADRVAVMYAGRVVEQGPTAELFARAAHPYTRHLIAAVPDMAGDREVVGLPGRAPSPGRRPVGCSFAERCEAATDECLEAFPPVDPVGPDHVVRCYHPRAPIADAGEAPEPHERQPRPAARRGRAHAHRSVRPRTPARRWSTTSTCRSRPASASPSSASPARARRRSRDRSAACTASGPARSSSVPRRWPSSARDRAVEQRLKIQYVFQNPYSSLNPRRPVGDSVARPLAIAKVPAADAKRRVGEMLERVSLTAAYADRYPDQLSGGERQRVAIARALVSQPDVLVCDEVTSALDVLVQAAVVELLAELQRDLGLSMLFVTHNLPLVRSVAHRVAVMADGRIVEIGSTEQVLTEPEQEYTRRLLADTPQIPDRRCRPRPA